MSRKTLLMNLLCLINCVKKYYIMWFKISFFIVLVISALYFGLLVYLGIKCPIVLIAIVVVTFIYIRYQLKKAVMLPPDVEF